MTNQSITKQSLKRVAEPNEIVLQLPNLATIQQTADALGVHKNTIRNWIEKGNLQAVIAGSRVVRIPRDAVIDMLRNYLGR
jgi:excisionase family DNA binding protein